MVRILQINVNGIRGKSRPLSKLVYDYNVSVLLVNELKTSNFYNYERADFEVIVGYTVYLESARCAIYVRNDLKTNTKQHVVGVDKQAKESRNPEDFFHCCAVSFAADDDSEQRLLIASCYRSPSATSDNTTDALQAIARIPGDFTHNCRRGLQRTTSASAPKRRTRRDKNSWNSSTRRRGNRWLRLKLEGDHCSRSV